MVPKTVYRRSYKKSFKLGYFKQILLGQEGRVINVLIFMLFVFWLLTRHTRGLGGDNLLWLTILSAGFQLLRVNEIGLGEVILWQDGISSNSRCNLNTRGKHWMKFEFNKINQVIINREKNSMFISGIVNEKEEFLVIRFLDAFKNYEDLIDQLKLKLGNKVKIGGEIGTDL